jgi:endonuclease YncB( thermonuclease family)
MQNGFGWAVANAPRVIFFTALLTPLAWGHELTGLVVHVADGDTITVLDSAKEQQKIRLLGIDAPEKKQAFGTKAKDAMAERVSGETVTVFWKHRDRYGRILGKVVLGTRDIDLEMVEVGLAWHYKQYVKEQDPADRVAYADAEIAARGAKTGLWVDASPMPPWEFRKNRHRPRAVARP